MFKVINSTYFIERLVSEIKSRCKARYLIPSQEFLHYIANFYAKKYEMGVEEKEQLIRILESRITFTMDLGTPVEA